MTSEDQKLVMRYNWDIERWCPVFGRGKLTLKQYRFFDRLFGWRKPNANAQKK